MKFWCFHLHIGGLTLPLQTLITAGLQPIPILSKDVYLQCLFCLLR